MVKKALDRERSAHAPRIRVLPCNLDTVQLFHCCQLDYIVAGKRTICQGFSAREIHAALAWSGLPAARWREIGEGLRLMGTAAASAINAQQDRARA